MIKKAQYAAQPIPTRFRFSGNIEKCKLLMGFAKQQFARAMEIDSPNKHNRHLIHNRKWPMIESKYGELIQMQMLAGVSVIDIFVPFNLMEEKEKLCKNVCLCACGIAIGVVTESVNSTYDVENAEWEHHFDRIPQAVDPFKIVACEEDRYAEKEDSMYSLDFYQHLATDVSAKPDHYFIIAEDAIDGVPYDLVMIDACKWHLFHLVSLSYKGPKTELICT